MFKFPLLIRPRRPALPPRQPMELRTFTPGTRAECCATCRWPALGEAGQLVCHRVAGELPADTLASGCAAWDLEPQAVRVHILYIALLAAARERQRLGLRYG